MTPGRRRSVRALPGRHGARAARAVFPIWPWSLHPGSIDPNYYLINGSDVHEAQLDPAEHFCRYGWREGRKPNIYFDTRWYQQTNPAACATADRSGGALHSRGRGGRPPAGALFRSAVVSRDLCGPAGPGGAGAFLDASAQPGVQPDAAVRRRLVRRAACRRGGRQPRSVRALPAGWDLPRHRSVAGLRRGGISQAPSRPAEPAVPRS